VGYEVFDGNRHDVTTVEDTVTKIEKQYGRTGRIWVMDRGMLSEDNLEFLQSGKRCYIIGTPKEEAWRQWAELSEGYYMLRTNITDWRAGDVWEAYIQLTQAETAFRIQKSDLKIRPIWHQKEERVQSHILVCFLAYVLWKMLGQMCKRAGPGDEPRQVFDEIAQIKVVDVRLPTKQGTVITRRCISQPTKAQSVLLQRLALHLPLNLKTYNL